MIRLDHLAISVRDPEMSSRWYTEKLGLKVEFEVLERAVALQDDSGFTLFVEKALSENINPSCVIYFQVEDVEKTYAKLKAASVTLSHPPQKTFWGYGAELRDPDNYPVRLWDEKSMKANEVPGK